MDAMTQAAITRAIIAAINAGMDVPRILIESTYYALRGDFFYILPKQKLNTVSIRANEKHSLFSRANYSDRQRIARF